MKPHAYLASKDTRRWRILPVWLIVARKITYNGHEQDDEVARWNKNEVLYWRTIIIKIPFSNLLLSTWTIQETTLKTKLLGGREDPSYSIPSSPKSTIQNVFQKNDFYPPPLESYDLHSSFPETQNRLCATSPLNSKVSPKSPVCLSDDSLKKENESTWGVEWTYLRHKVRTSKRLEQKTLKHRKL